jgi:prenyltransferase beta subunit
MALGLGLALALLALMQVSLAGAPAPQDPIDPSNHADVVVDFGDGHLTVRRITFISPTISSLEALQLSGLDTTVASFDFGAAICAVDGVGCSADNCFCDDTRFWGLYRWQDGAWVASQVGAGDAEVKPGDVDGWRWGDSSRTPPAVSAPFLAAHAGLQWLRSQQANDGSFGGNAGGTLDTVVAIAAAGEYPGNWRSTIGASPLGYVRRQAAGFARREESRASAGKLALGVAAAGLDPRRFAGLDLVDSMTAVYSPTTGLFGSSNWDQAFNMLGWRAAGAAVPMTATLALIARANADGGWGWNQSSDSDVDTTALAVQALLAAGEATTSTAVVDGLAYMAAAQNRDGGFPYSPTSASDTGSNANSTAFAVQAILAAGQDPASASWTISSTTPISYLLGQQMAEGGFAFAEPPANDFATRQVVPALLGQTLNLRSPTVARREGVAWIAAQQQDDGGFAGFNPGATIDAMAALAAAGRNITAYAGADGQTALDYLATQAADYADQGPSAAGKLAFGVAVAGADPADFADLNLVAQIEDSFDQAAGLFGTAGSTWDQAWSMLGLAAAGESLPVSATVALEALQLDSGGWGFDAAAEAADVDSTALALQALAAAGQDETSPAVRQGLAYLASAQNADGGFPGFDGVTSASSTGLALQALAAFDQEPQSLAWTGLHGNGLPRPNPLEALLALQSPDGGFAGFSGPNDGFATYQALPGLLGKAYPMLASQR